MRNEAAFVGACLDSLLDQLTDLQDVEILCVDGASKDKTRDIVITYAAKDSRVRLIDNPQKIVPTAMNTAIRQSRGDIIIRLDCHAEYGKNYIKNCIEVLQRTEADNVGGYITTAPIKDTRVARAIVATTSSRFGVGGSSFRTGGGEQEVDTVPFGCFRRDVFERFGMYDERLVRNQDIELNSRIRKGGGKIVISPSIKLTYYTRSTFTGLRQQAFNNGLWNPYTIYLTGGGLRLRHFIPLSFVLSLLCLAIGGLFFHPLWYLLAIELLAYLSAAGFVSLQLRKEANTSWLLLLLSFIQLHLSYGLGSLWGLLSAPFKFGLRPTHNYIGTAIADRKD